MKINELKRIAEENDYEFTKVLCDFSFTKRKCKNHINISGDFENRIWISCPAFCDDEDFNMIKASVKFAETPLDEREEEKKYYYKHRWAKTKNGNWMYMALRKRPNISYLTLQGSSEDVFEYQVRFTKKEIDDIKEKYKTDLSDFELVEVEE